MEALMHVLFIHPEFPTQFRYIAPWLAREHGWDCTFLTRPSNAPDLPGVRRVNYDPSQGPTPGGNPCGRRFEASLGHALGVYDALKTRPEIKPDLVVSHGSFGSSLFLPCLYDCPIINFFEYFYRPVG